MKLQKVTHLEGDKLHPDVQKALQLCNRVSVDAEWYTPQRNKTAQYLTKQFTFSVNFRAVITVVLWHQDYPLPNSDYISALSAKYRQAFIVLPCDVQHCDITYVQEYFRLELQREMSLGMYYSPKDVEAAVGRDNWLRALIGEPGNAKVKPTVKKFRNLNGFANTVSVKWVLDDMLGLFNTSLEKAFSMVGIDNPFKNYAVKPFKTRAGKRDKGAMNLFMKDDPEEFFAYAVGDTMFLDEALVKRCDQVNRIITEALGFNPGYTPDNLPRSSGSLVAKTFELWMIDKYPDVLRSALLLTDATNRRGYAIFHQLKDELINGGDLKAINAKARDTTLIHGLHMGGIRNYAMLSSKTTGLLGAMVQGGRCVVEEPHTNPEDCRAEHVIDVDFDSCYGSSLEILDYPVGIPTIVQFSRDDSNQMTLGDFMKRHSYDLIPNLYHLVVSGTLSFDQDLIPSKYGLDIDSIESKLISLCADNETTTFDAWEREVEPAHLDGKFLHTTRQIQEGVINSDIWNVIKAVFSASEMGEVLKLKLECAVYYPLEEEVQPQRWARNIMRCEGGKKLGTGDARPRQWCRLPLREFVGGFVAYRKRLKTEMKSLRPDDPRREELDILQNAGKLFVNTTYGCLAAPYFPMGNTVLANNITAKARVGAWMLSKACLTKQSITDGGILDYQNVAFLKPEERLENGRLKYPLPSMHTLANRELLVKHRSVMVQPLTGANLHALMQFEHRSGNAKRGLTNWLNDLVTDHIANFWSRYTYEDEDGTEKCLELPFKLDIKVDHTCLQAVWFNADYILYGCTNSTSSMVVDKVSGERCLLKARGAKGKDHPKLQWLWFLLNPLRYPKPTVMYKASELIGVSDFQKNYKRYTADELMPGDEMEVVTGHKPYKVGQLPKTYSEWKKLEDSHARAVRRWEKSKPENEREHFGLAKQVISRWLDKRMK